jgi:hypothetical protein
VPKMPSGSITIIKIISIRHITKLRHWHSPGGVTKSIMV